MIDGLHYSLFLMFIKFSDHCMGGDVDNTI
jgi:hypothetical protein